MKNIKIIGSIVLSFFVLTSPVLAQVVTDSSLIGDGSSLTPLGTNEAFSHFWSALQSFTANGIGATKVSAISLVNSNAATSSVKNEYPPALNLLGTTYGGGSSYTTGWRFQPSSTTASRGLALMPQLDLDVTYDGSTWANMLSLHANSTGTNRSVSINNTLTVGDGNNTSVVGSFNGSGDIQTTKSLYSGDNGTNAGILGLEGSTFGTWSLSAPSHVTNYKTFVPDAQGDVNSLWLNDGAGNMANTILTSGSFSDTGAATTTFTVIIGQTMPNTTFKVQVTPTDANSTSPYFVTNKTTTTFDVEYPMSITGAMSFDYFIYQ